MPTKSSVAILAAAVLLLGVAKAGSAQQTRGISGLQDDVTSDFKYLINNVFMDGEDIVTSPLYIEAPDSPFRSPNFYLALAATGAVFGGSFALDQTMRSHLEGIRSSDADL